VAGGILNRQVSITTWLPYALGGSIMRQGTRGWIMPEADMLCMLRLINEKIRSRMIDARHQDVLVRLREILENDLNDHYYNRQPTERPEGQEMAT
jgi:hypothetical protein